MGVPVSEQRCLLWMHECDVAPTCRHRLQCINYAHRWRNILAGVERSDVFERQRTYGGQILRLWPAFRRSTHILLACLPLSRCFPLPTYRSDVVQKLARALNWTACAELHYLLSKESGASLHHSPFIIRKLQTHSCVEYFERTACDPSWLEGMQAMYIANHSANISLVSLLDDRYCIAIPVLPDLSAGM